MNWQQDYYRRRRAARRHPRDPDYEPWTEEDQRAFEDAMRDIWEEEIARRRAEGRY